jgi:thiol-disulfide isomerase/thioredoxin
MREAPDAGRAVFARKEYDPTPIEAGQAVPDFSIPALQGDSTITETDLRGKLVLIDFWATWCAPCIEELPNIRRLYDRYADDGFTVLSVSFDRHRSDVQRFRQNQSPMPWTHAFVSDGLSSDLALTFDVKGLPTKVLVGRDGDILAAGTGDELTGEQLGAKLREAFSK